jgi:hypothetical protein
VRPAGVPLSGGGLPRKHRSQEERNGDVFEWRSVWPALAETLGVQTGGDMPMSGAAYIDKNADLWNQVVTKCGLRSRNLRELIGHGDQHANFAFAYGAPAGPLAFVSTIKLRQAWFTKVIDTEQAFRKGLQSLIERKLHPPGTIPQQTYKSGSIRGAKQRGELYGISK